MRGAHVPNVLHSQHVWDAVSVVFASEMWSDRLRRKTGCVAFGPNWRDREVRMCHIPIHPTRRRWRRLRRRRRRKICRETRCCAPIKWLRTQRESTSISSLSCCCSLCGDDGGSENDERRRHRLCIYCIWLTLVSRFLLLLLFLRSSRLIFIAFILLPSFVGSSSSLVRPFVCLAARLTHAHIHYTRAPYLVCVRDLFFFSIWNDVDLVCGAYQGEQ